MKRSKDFLYKYKAEIVLMVIGILLLISGLFKLFSFSKINDLGIKLEMRCSVIKEGDRLIITCKK